MRSRVQVLSLRRPNLARQMRDPKYENPYPRLYSAAYEGWVRSVSAYWSGMAQLARTMSHQSVDDHGSTAVDKSGGSPVSEQQPKVISGKLTRRAIGNRSMPCDAPYYQNAPFYYRDARAVTVVYETDAEAAAAILPEALQLPLPATMTLQVIHYPFSTFGEYHEAILSVNCLYQGMPRAFVGHILVNSVPPLVAGREIWGYPKKMADITLEQAQNLVVGRVLQPGGASLLDLSMRPETPIEVDDKHLPGGISLRIIPNPEEGAETASLCELIDVASVGQVTHEAWAGPASVNLAGASQFVPWHLYPVGKVISAMWTRADFHMPHGKILARV